jgi:hypothetical protein
MGFLVVGGDDATDDHGGGVRVAAVFLLYLPKFFGGFHTGGDCGGSSSGG